MDEPTRQRRLPRFSLRSLILFVTLAGSGYGLWARWEPWQVVKQIPINFKFVGNMAAPPWWGDWRFSANEEEVIACSLDVGHGGGRIAVYEYRLTLANEKLSVRMELEDYKPNFHVSIPGGGSNTSNLYSKDRTWRVDADNDLNYPSLWVWKRRRPEYWWGVAWLPEFWLTVVLGVGLVWSLWRDSRIMRA